VLDLPSGVYLATMAPGKSLLEKSGERGQASPHRLNLLSISSPTSASEYGFCDNCVSRPRVPGSNEHAIGIIATTAETREDDWRIRGLLLR
jgi:hypothetical protein